MIVLEQIQIEEKTSLYQKKVELIVEKTGGIELSETFEYKELKQDVGKERDVSVHETEISTAEEFKVKDVTEEKNTSIKGVQFGKEAELEKDVTKAVLVVTDENDASVHEAEISVASIPVQERKEETMSKSRKHKRELEDLQAGVKYHMIYHTKKQRLMMKERQFFLEKSWNTKGRKE